MALYSTLVNMVIFGHIDQAHLVLLFAYVLLLVRICLSINNIIVDILNGIPDISYY